MSVVGWISDFRIRKRALGIGCILPTNQKMRQLGHVLSLREMQVLRKHLNREHSVTRIRCRKTQELPTGNIRLCDFNPVIRKRVIHNPFHPCPISSSAWADLYIVNAYLGFRPLGPTWISWLHDGSWVSDDTSLNGKKLSSKSPQSRTPHLTIKMTGW